MQKNYSWGKYLYSFEISQWTTLGLVTIEVQDFVHLY